MNRIRLLAEQVANQIAAGEVVERPASVVKELVENSLDAEASRICVEVQAGGRSLIRVIDDGFGMSRDDALLCLERHATSKIRRAEDLSAVATMGFRGEALPSIASVSRFTLTTRERGDSSPEGTQVIITGGKIVDVKAAGRAPGTSIEVRQLFFNLPARRKFLRTEETEAAHIQHYLTLAALAHPEVGFVFQRDGRVIWQLPAVERRPEAAGADLRALQERLRALYGDEQRLLTVDLKTQLGAVSTDEEQDSPTDAAVRVWGFIGAPGISRATREDQHLFVNRRPIENRALNFALLEGYHTSLMKGRYPVCCLFIEVHPAEVDVNIHPAKREVKFHREYEVRQVVTRAIREALLRFAQQAAPRVPESADSTLSAPTRPDIQPTSLLPLSPALPNFPAALAPRTEPDSQSSVQTPLHLGFTPATTQIQQSPSPAPLAAEQAVEQAGPIAVRSEPTSGTGTPAVTASSAVPLLAVPLRLIGVVGKLYVLLESDRGLVLLDQHAAHERILFEQMLNRLQQQEQAASQKLLLPETVELSTRDSAFLREQLPVLTRLGVGLSEFGERTFLLDALPPFVKAPDPRHFILELVDGLKTAGQGVNAMRLGEHVVAKTVCRHAVKAHDPLAGAELQKLIEDLRHCEMPYTCPHGRPTIIEMNFRELEKKFGRVT